jgi:hypothetical protein
MNPRRVHELMRHHFPEVKRGSFEWIVAADENGLRFDVLGSLVDKYIPAGDLLVEVQRKVGDLFGLVVYRARSASLVLIGDRRPAVQ